MTQYRLNTVVYLYINNLFSFLAKDFKTVYYDDVTNSSGLKGQ